MIQQWRYLAKALVLDPYRTIFAICPKLVLSRLIHENKSLLNEFFFFLPEITSFHFTAISMNVWTRFHLLSVGFSLPDDKGCETPSVSPLSHAISISLQRHIQTIQLPSQRVSECAIGKVERRKAFLVDLFAFLEIIRVFYRGRLQDEGRSNPLDAPVSQVEEIVI